MFQFLFIFYFAKYEPIKYAKVYSYPWWGEVLGFCISSSSMVMVPGYALYYLATSSGSLRERLAKGITPVIKPRADAVEQMRELELEEKRLQNKEDEKEATDSKEKEVDQSENQQE